MKKKVVLISRRASSKARSVMPVESDFAEIVNLIQTARQRSVQAMNTEPSDLYRRMLQFFETYRDDPILSTLVRVLPWSSHLGLLKGGKA